MYTSLVLVVLAASATVPAATNSPSWHRNYEEAHHLGSQRHKPLAVFLSHGPTGWQKVVNGGKLNSATERLLSDHYVCVYLDTNKSAGAKLAERFEMPDGTGVVLSDFSGNTQAFRNEGTLSAVELEQSLRKYADPERAVVGTESGNVQRVSNYAPPAATFVPAFAPQPIFFGGFGGFGGGGGGGC